MVQDLEDGKSNTKVCKSYNLSSSTVSTIWENRDSIIKSLMKVLEALKRDALTKIPRLMMHFIRSL